MTRFSSFVVALIAGAAVGGSANAGPVTISFSRIEPHAASQNPASQLSCVMDSVKSGPGGKVSFRFTNAGGISSSISEIFFQNAPFLGAATLTQVGTDFSTGGASPGNLPGGSSLTPAFVATDMFSADAHHALNAGINSPSDSLVMTFNLLGNKSYEDCLSTLDAGQMRIGLHVHDIGWDGQSDSFVNKRITAVPLPTASSLAMAGLSMIAVRRRRA